MAPMSESLTILNGLLYDARGNVTTSAQKILDIFAVPENIRGQIKTITIRNFGTNRVYIGSDATVTTSNAGDYIEKASRLEIPLPDIQRSPYFIAGATNEIGILIWG